MVNYKTIDGDIKIVKRLAGTYDSDCVEFYEALGNVLEYAEDQRELDKD